MIKRKAFFVRRLRAAMIIAAGVASGIVYAQDAPAPPPIVAPAKTVQDIIDLEVGFVTLRNRRSLAPRTYLYVDLNRLDKDRYTVLRPEEAATYAVSRPKGDDNPGASDASRVAMGVPPRRKDPESSSPASPPRKPRTLVPKIEGMRLPGQQGEEPISVSEVVLSNGVARLLVMGIEQGDKIRLTLKNVAETVTIAPTPPNVSADALTALPVVGADTFVTGVRPVNLQVRKIVTLQDSIGITFRPNLIYAQNQKLTDGRSKSLFQIPLPFQIPSVGERNGANIYVRSDTLISTDRRDLASRLNLTIGRERNVARDPAMAPEYLDFHVDANQSFRNVSAGVGYGVRRRRGNRPDPLWENALRSETAAILSLDTYFNYKLENDVQVTPRHAARLDFAVIPGVEAPAIKLFRLPDAVRPMQMIYGGRIFLLPFEKGAFGKAPNYVEYSFNVGFLIPLPRLLGAERQLRIDVVSGANPVSGYARSQTYSFRVVPLSAAF